MSELNSSDNNSVSEHNNNSFSENNSIEENASNPPESTTSASVSIGSPSSQKLSSDDFKIINAKNDSESSSIQHQQQNINDDMMMMSLPVALQSQVLVNKTITYSRSATYDPELTDLLTRKQPKFIPQAPKCAKCDKSVYKAEETRAANKTFHKLCFKCNSCNKLLETNILTEHQGDLYCRVCYSRNFGPKGYGYGSGAGILSSDSPNTLNNNNISPVYITSSSSLKSTFSSYKPDPRINSINNNDNNTSPSNNGEAKENHHINQLVNTLLSSSSSISTPSPTPSSNSDSSPPATISSISSQPMSNSVHVTMRSSASHNGSYQMSALNHEKRNSSISLTNSIIYGGSDRCGRCMKAVYAAEKVVAAGKPYHKLCFSCNNCKKMLSSMNCCDNSDGEIFCKACYGKNFGPKGIGYGIGAGTLTTN